MANIVGDVEITANRAEGHFGNPITIFQARLSRNRDMAKFLLRLKEAGILEGLLCQLEERMDGDCSLHLRLDKQQAFLGGLAIATDKDVIDCRLKVAAYPANMERALETARNHLSKLIADR